MDSLFQFNVLDIACQWQAFRQDEDHDFCILVHSVSKIWLLEITSIRFNQSLRVWNNMSFPTVLQGLTYGAHFIFDLFLPFMRFPNPSWPSHNWWWRGYESSWASWGTSSARLVKEEEEAKPPFHPCADLTCAIFSIGLQPKSKAVNLIVEPLNPISQAEKHFDCNIDWWQRFKPHTHLEANNFRYFWLVAPLDSWFSWGPGVMKQPHAPCDAVILILLFCFNNQHWSRLNLDHPKPHKD